MDWNSIATFFDSPHHQQIPFSYSPHHQQIPFSYSSNCFDESVGLGCYYPNNNNNYFYPFSNALNPLSTTDYSSYYPDEVVYGLDSFFDGMYFSPPMNYPLLPSGVCGYKTLSHKMETAPKSYTSDFSHSRIEKYNEGNLQNNKLAVNQKNYHQKYQNNTYYNNTNNYTTTNNNKWRYYQSNINNTTSYNSNNKTDNNNNKSNVGNESFDYPQNRERFGNANSSNGSSYPSSVSSWTRDVNGTYVFGGVVKNNGSSWNVHNDYNNRTRNTSWDRRNNSWDDHPFDNRVGTSSSPFGSSRNSWCAADFDLFGARTNYPVDDRSCRSGGSSSIGSYYDESDTIERPSVWFRFPTPTQTHLED